VREHLAVLALTPTVRSISRQETLAARTVGQILTMSTSDLGRPIRLPLALAAASPDLTRPRINSRSNSAIEAKIPNTRRPFGVLVSTPSCKALVRILFARIELSPEHCFRPHGGPCSGNGMDVHPNHSPP